MVKKIDEHVQLAIQDSRSVVLSVTLTRDFILVVYRGRNDDLMERVNTKLKKSDETSSTVSKKVDELEGEQRNIGGLSATLLWYL